MLKQFIEQLSTDMKFEQVLDANEDGSYSLRLEPNIDVLLKERSNQEIKLQVSLAPLPQERREECLQKMMVANLLGRATGGAALGLDKEGKRVVLVDFLIDEEKYKHFYDRLEEFVNYAEAWRQEIMEFGET